MEWVISILIFLGIVWIVYCLYQSFVYCFWYYWENEFKDLKLIHKLIVITTKAIIISVVVIISIFVIYLIKSFVFGGVI